MSWSKKVRAVEVFSLLAVAGAFLLVSSHSTRADSDPWKQAQTVQPSALAKELEDSQTAPMVVFVGFGRLYTAGHIKGAQYHGTTSKEDGLKEFSTWAAKLPRTANILIYCGCCPMDRCPNIRPAFKALQDLGFQQVRVLILPNDFASDWAEKGFPYEKGN